MRLPAIIFLYALLCLPAYADGWRTYLQITCEPSIGHFSLRPVGTRNFDAPASSGFIPIDRGTKQSENFSIVTEPGSDLFARCEIPDWDNNHKYAPLVFEVIRTKSWGTGHCSGCGNWSADFEVLANSRRIAKDQVGRTDIAVLDTIQFDSEELLMCSTSTAFSYRERDTNGRFSHTCKAGPVDTFPTR
jgi:hypothetical protein